MPDRWVAILNGSSYLFICFCLALFVRARHQTHGRDGLVMWFYFVAAMNAANAVAMIILAATEPR